MKNWFVLGLLILMCCSVFATSYRIIDYYFDVPGKTMDYAVKRLIVPDSEEIFDSEENLVNALNGKKQTLTNQRVFKSVDYSYLLGECIDDVVPVSVTFKIQDAKSFLILPYPKYDSNFGTRLGAKMWDSNLFGTLAQLYGNFHATFEDNNWSNPIYYGRFDLTDFLLGKTTMSFTIMAEGRPGDELYDYSMSSSFYNIPLLWGTWLNLDLSSSKSGDGTKYTLSSNLGGIKLGSVGFTPSFDCIHYDKATGSSYYIPSIKIKGVNLWNIDISFSDSIKLIPTAEGFNNNITPYYITHATDLSFNDNFLHGVNFSNTITYYPSAEENAINLYFNNTSSYVLSDASTLYLMEDIATASDSKKVVYFDTGLGISQKIIIGSKVSVTPKLCEFLRIYPTESGLDYARYYTLEASTSGDNVNWIGNFRDGIKYSVKVSEAWMQRYDVRDAFGEKGGVFDHLEISTYKLLWGWFNPSARLILNYAVNKEGYNYLFGSSYSTIGEELRGIRNNQVDNVNLLAVVANINLMTYFPLPSFISFVDAYANIFFDYALLKKDLATPAKNYYGVGFEGIGILKEYPSYPIRLSVGFDLNGLINYIKNGGHNSFYEIYFGMGFLF